MPQKRISTTATQRELTKESLPRLDEQIAAKKAELAALIKEAETKIDLAALNRKIAIIRDELEKLKDAKADIEYKMALEEVADFVKAGPIRARQLETATATGETLETGEFSQNAQEMRIAQVFSGAEKAADFLKSREHHLLKSELVESLQNCKNPTLSTFVRIEFTKLASLETFEARSRRVKALTLVLKYFASLERKINAVYPPEIFATLVSTDTRSEVPENIRKYLTHEHEEPEVNVMLEACDLVRKLHFVQSHLGDGSDMDVEPGFASYVVLELFRRGELKVLMPDEELLKAVSYNPRGHFNFIQIKGNTILMRGKPLAPALQERIKKEMQRMAMELVPSLNVQQAIYPEQNLVLIQGQFGLSRDDWGEMKTDAIMASPSYGAIYEENQKAREAAAVFNEIGAQLYAIAQFANAK